MNNTYFSQEKIENITEISLILENLPKNISNEIQLQINLEILQRYEFFR